MAAVLVDVEAAIKWPGPVHKVMVGPSEIYKKNQLGMVYHFRATVFNCLMIL